jgi:hypothetical protein
MADETNQTVQVPPNAGSKDGLQSVGRSLLFLIGVVSTLLGFFNAHDLAGAATYVQQNIGQTITAILAVAGFIAATYGAIKARRRGGQLEDAAANPANKAVTFK